MYAQNLIKALSAEDPSAAIPYFTVLAANHAEYDKFHLFEDSRIPDPDLDNSIHPIWHIDNWRGVDEDLYELMKPALQLASMFIQPRSMREWFVPLVHSSVKEDEKTGKPYLPEHPDILKNPKVKRAKVLEEVQSYLNCLTHSVILEIGDRQLHATGYTITDNTEPPHTSNCPPRHNNHLKSVRMIFRLQWKEYLIEELNTTSQAENLRFYFLFALTLTHELAHAVGVLRRGDTVEAYLRVDDLHKEYGFAWEEFAVGGRIDPFERVSCRMPFFTWRLWRTSNNDNKDYVIVPMRWVAQWFQKSTWRAIRRHGPRVVKPPEARLMLRIPRRGKSKWMLISDDSSALSEFLAFRDEVELILESMEPSEYPPDIRALFLINTAMKHEVNDFETGQPPADEPWSSALFAKFNSAKEALSSVSTRETSPREADEASSSEISAAVNSSSSDDSDLEEYTPSPSESGDGDSLVGSRKRAYSLLYVGGEEESSSEAENHSRTVKRMKTAA